MGVCNSQQIQKNKNLNLKKNQKLKSFQDVLNIFQSLQNTPKFNDKYIEGNILGSGVNGNVKRIIHKELKVERVMKKIDLDFLDQQNIKRIIYSAQICKRLNHPCVQSLIEYYIYNQHVHLIYKYFEGITLQQHFKENNQKLQETEVIFYVYKLLEIVQYLDSQNIVHGDIKLSNIIINKNEVYLIDFDSVQIVQQQQQKSMVEFGTPVYCSPEVVQGYVSCKSDIWSIGIIMYILLTGRTPFSGKSDSQIYQQILSAKLQSKIKQNQSISKEAIEFLIQLLQQKSAERKNAKELLQNPFLQNGFKNYSKNLSENFK